MLIGLGIAIAAFLCVFVVFIGTRHIGHLLTRRYTNLVAFLQTSTTTAISLVFGLGRGSTKLLQERVHGTACSW